MCMLSPSNLSFVDLIYGDPAGEPKWVVEKIFSFPTHILTTFRTELRLSLISILVQTLS